MKWIPKILYFGQPGNHRTLNIESKKPPNDYESQEEIDPFFKDFKQNNSDCLIEYVNVSKSSNELIEKYDIDGSHVWIIKYSDTTFKKYDDDTKFFEEMRNNLWNSYIQARYIYTGYTSNLGVFDHPRKKVK